MINWFKNYRTKQSLYKALMRVYELLDNADDLLDPCSWLLNLKPPRPEQALKEIRDAQEEIRWIVNCKLKAERERDGNGVTLNRHIYDKKYIIAKWLK